MTCDNRGNAPVGNNDYGQQPVPLKPGIHGTAGEPLLIDGLVSWEWDVVTGTCRFSEGWADITGPEGEGCLDSDDWFWWTSRLHMADLPRLRQAQMDVLAGTVDGYEMTFRLLMTDGRWKWLLSRARVTARATDGTPSLISGVLMDVSHLREDPAFRNESDTGPRDISYQVMLWNSPDLYMRLVRSLLLLYANPAAAKYTARSKESSSLADSLENHTMDPRLLEFLRKNVKRVFTRSELIREITTFTTPRGEEVTGEYSLWPEFDATGKIRYVMTRFHDHTRLYHADLRAKLNERRLSALYRLT